MNFVLPQPMTLREDDLSPLGEVAGDRVTPLSAVVAVQVPVAKPWTCALCGSTLSLSRGVAQQLESQVGIHRARVRYSCAKCLQHASDNYRSVASHHGRCKGPLTCIRPVTCPVPGCEFRCAHRSGLGQHNSWRHPEGQLARRKGMLDSTGYARARKWYSPSEILLIQRGMDRGESPTTVAIN